MPETPRPLSFSERHRDRVREQTRTERQARGRANGDRYVADLQDWSTAIEAGEIHERDIKSTWPHLLATLLTGGAWGPVWLFVAWRNHRRLRRTGPGQRSAERRRAMNAGLNAASTRQRRQVAKESWADALGRRRR